MKSNHPPTVLKQIPIGINTRLSTISSNKEHFDKAKEPYQKALNESEHDFTLEFKPTEPRNPRRNKNKRNILWYNPPFNLATKTNIGKKFLQLVSDHFPKNHPLHPICNRNTLKLSYSTTRNLKQIIQSHNQKILSQFKKAGEEKTKACNCQKNRKDKCPLRGECIQKNVIYEATTAEDPPRKYIGSTESFKERHATHVYSFRHEAQSNATTLSHHIHENKLGPEPALTWDVIDRAPAYTKGARACHLCLTEKLHIMMNIGNPAYLNKRNELAQKCRHRAKFRLSALR